MGDLILFQKPGVCDLLPICFNLSKDERNQYTALTGQRYDPEIVAANTALGSGPSWFVTDGEKPLAAAGFTPIRPGVYDTWMLATPEVWAHHAKALTKYVDDVMVMMLGAGGAHRLQCVALADRLQAHRWYVRCIGLAPEGTLQGYGCKGEDAIIFSRVRAIQ